jgi:hypothetical protein
MVITLGEIHYQACGNLLHSVQTGLPAANAAAADAFNQDMANVSSMLAYAVLMAYDFAGVKVPM